MVQQKPLDWKTWKNAGIYYINDLLHDSLPRFLSHAELGAKYRITSSFLELLQLRSAIPPLWKRLIVQPAMPDLEVKPTIWTAKGDSINIINKSSKTTCRTLIQYLKPVVSSQLKWNEKFPVATQDIPEHWEKIYKSPCRVARGTKLQAFQYRIAHRFLPCNRLLKNIRIFWDDTWTFCLASDTIEHFLFDCPLVKAFSPEVINWMDRETGLQLTVSSKTFLFGVPEALPQATSFWYSQFFLFIAKSCSTKAHSTSSTSSMT